MCFFCNKCNINKLNISGCNAYQSQIPNVDTKKNVSITVISYSHPFLYFVFCSVLCRSIAAVKLKFEQRNPKTASIFSWCNAKNALLIKLPGKVGGAYPVGTCYSWTWPKNNVINYFLRPLFSEVEKMF